MSSNAISQAIEAGDLAAFQARIQALPRNARPAAYESSAQAAVRADQLAILTECLRVGRVSAAGYPGFDLALVAARHGTPATLAVLHDDGGLDVTEPPNDHLGSNFLNFCVREGNLRLLKYLLRRRGYTLDDFGPKYGYMGTSGPFSDAAIAGRPEVLAYLLRHNTEPARLEGVLHLAARFGHAAIVKLLLERRLAGVDDVARASWSRDPCTPLQAAAYGRSLAAVRCLLDAGADVAKADPQGRDVLEWSRAVRDPDRPEWPELLDELRQRGLLGKLGRE